MGESKHEVMQFVPESVKPKTILIKLPATVTHVTDVMHAAGLTFPLILKPDLGERGCRHPPQHLTLQTEHLQST